MVKDLFASPGSHPEIYNVCPPLQRHPQTPSPVIPVEHSAKRFLVGGPADWSISRPACRVDLRNKVEAVVMGCPESRA